MGHFCVDGELDRLGSSCRLAAVRAAQTKLSSHGHSLTCCDCRVVSVCIPQGHLFLRCSGHEQVILRRCWQRRVVPSLCKNVINSPFVCPEVVKSEQVLWNLVILSSVFGRVAKSQMVI